MGTDLALLVAHRLSSHELRTLPERFLGATPMREAAETLWNAMQRRWPNLGPLAEFLACVPTRRAELDVPGKLMSFDWAGFALSFGKHAVLAQHPERFAAFSEDLDGLRQPIMRCVGALARELQSPRIAYGPDQGSPTFDVLLDAVLDGQCFDDVVLRLRPDWIVEAAD